MSEARDTETDARRFAYAAYAHQIEREDGLYQQRVNFSLVTNGSILVFYAALIDKQFGSITAKAAFLLLVCALGFSATILFERGIDRGYRRIQELKVEYEARLGPWAERADLPMPSMPKQGYTTYPFSELTMYLFGFWFLVSLFTILVVGFGDVGKGGS